MRQKALDATVAMLKSVGPRRPIEVRPLGKADAADGGYKYEIVTGVLLYHAYRELAIPSIRARVLLCDEYEAVRSRMAETIRDSGPDTWPKLVAVARMQQLLAARRGCTPAEIPQDDIVASTPLDKATVSLCIGAYRSLVDADVDLRNPELHNVPREVFRLINNAAGRAERVQELIRNATATTALRGQAALDAADAQFGSITTTRVKTGRLEITATLSAIKPEELDSYLRYVGRIVRRAHREHVSTTHD